MGAAAGPIDVFILGRVLEDLYPLQSETPLEDVRTFERFVKVIALSDAAR